MAKLGDPEPSNAKIQRLIGMQDRAPTRLWFYLQALLLPDNKIAFATWS